MAITKTEVISVRVPPDIKAALASAAEAERRSLASMLEVMVLEYCRAHDPLGFFEPPQALAPAGLDPLGFFEPPQALAPAGLEVTRQTPSP